jgi:uncharacterized membrane protein HdeD (DUF308 family)
MNSLKISSIIVFIIGILLLTGGLILYKTEPINSWSSLLILLGVLIMLSGIIMLSSSIQYDKHRINIK